MAALQLQYIASAAEQRGQVISPADVREITAPPSEDMYHSWKAAASDGTGLKTAIRYLQRSFLE